MFVENNTTEQVVGKQGRLQQVEFFLESPFASRTACFSFTSQWQVTLCRQPPGQRADTGSVFYFAFLGFLGARTACWGRLPLLSLGFSLHSDATLRVLFGSKGFSALPGSRRFASKLCQDSFPLLFTYLQSLVNVTLTNIP